MYYLGPYGNYSLLLELLLLIAVSVRQCRRRKQFALRLTLCAVGLTILTFLVNHPIAWNDYSGLNRPYMYVAALTAGVYCCFELTIWQAGYLMTVAYAVQYSMYSLWLFLCVILIPGFEFFLDTPMVNVCYGFALICALGESLFVSRKNKYLSTLEHFSVPVFSVFVLVVMAAAGLTGIAIQMTSFHDMMIVRIACTIICVLGIAYASTTLVYQAVTLNHALYEQIIQRQKEEYEQRRASVDDLNIKCHDLKYQIRSVFQHKNGDSGEALKDIEAAIGSIQNAYHTGNDALDVIISEKARLCSAKGISFTFMGDGSQISFMKDVDIYRLFNNAIDNAIEAVVQVEEEKRIIDVTIQRSGPFLNCHFENYCSGSLSVADGLPVTSKEDKTNHGFGVRSMRSIAGSYQGELRFRQEGEIFTLDLFFPEVRKTA